MKFLKPLWERIDSIPFKPKLIPEPFGTVLFSLPDLPAFLTQNGCRSLPFLPRFAPFYYGYSRQFTRRIFNVTGRVRIDAVMAKKRTAESLVILVPGIFQSKNFKFIRDMAKRLNVGHSVIVLDTRDHLSTFSLSADCPASGGTVEGKDLLDIAEQLKAENARLRIYLIGFSYGGGIVLNALNSEKAKDVLSGVVAVSPTMILTHAVEHIDTNPGISSPFSPIYSLFRTCLRLRYGLGIKSFQEYIERAALQYGTTAHAMLTKSSITSFIDRIAVPTLMVAAKDDPVIPQEDINHVSALARSNDHVHLMVKARGGHIAFAFIDQHWFYTMIKEFSDKKWSGI